MTMAPRHCPGCSGPLAVTRLHCDACDLSVAGHFAWPQLLRLSPEELRFAEDFLRASGSLKAVARQHGVSYPTVRQRLDALIAKLEPDDEIELAKHRILDQIAAGRLSAADAARMLEALADEA